MPNNSRNRPSKDIQEGSLLHSVSTNTTYQIVKINQQAMLFHVRNLATQEEDSPITFKDIYSGEYPYEAV